MNGKKKLIFAYEELVEWPPGIAHVDMRVVGKLEKRYLMDLENLRITQTYERLQGRPPYDMLPKDIGENILLKEWGIKIIRKPASNITFYMRNNEIIDYSGEIQIKNFIEILDSIYNMYPKAKKVIPRNRMINFAKRRENINHLLYIIQLRSLVYPIQETTKSSIDNLLQIPIFWLIKERERMKESH